MNWRQPITLFVLAAALAAFILLVERPARLARQQTSGPPLVLPAFAPASVTSIEVRSASNNIVLRKAQGRWEVSMPAWRPAHPQLIEGFLHRIATLRGRSLLSAAELQARGGATGEFGLNPPAVTLLLTGPAGNTEIMLGTHQLDGRRVFYKVTGLVGIFATDSSLLDALPTQAQAWRDTGLLTLDPMDPRAFDRLRVTSAGGGFTLARAPGNGDWELTEPRPARADAQRVALLLEQLKLAQILNFIAPTSTPGVEGSGLQSPRLVLSLAQGSNEVFNLAFGAALTNSGAVMAQRRGDDDLLAVPADALDLLRIPYKQLLDSRVIRFDAGKVREIVLNGPDEFRAVLQTNTWRLLPGDIVADRQLIQRLLDQLGNLEIVDIAKEVVTPLDLPSYGLSPPAKRITLRSAPGDTNANLAVLETGALRDNQIFARVPGEEPVYALNPAHVAELPEGTWQLRDRTLWRFTPAMVSSIRVRDNEFEWSIRHLGTNDWAPPPSWRNDVNPFALEEAVYQFSQARPLRWIAEGDSREHVFGTTRAPEIQFEFRPNPPAPLRSPLRIVFGKPTLSGNRYAAMTAPDGVRLIFEFPGAVYENLWKEIGLSDSTGR